MTTKKAEHPLGEAPASVNFKGVTKGGFTCQWTLRDFDENTLLDRQVVFMEKLKEGGVVSLGQKPTVKQADPLPPVAGNGGQAENWCAIHSVEMTKWDKEGRSWFSHKADDDTWCKGK